MEQGLRKISVRSAFVNNLEHRGSEKFAGFENAANTADRHFAFGKI